MLLLGYSYTRSNSSIEAHYSLGSFNLTDLLSLFDILSQQPSHNQSIAVITLIYWIHSKYYYAKILRSFTTEPNSPNHIVSQSIIRIVNNI